MYNRTITDHQYCIWCDHSPFTGSPLTPYTPVVGCRDLVLSVAIISECHYSQLFLTGGGGGGGVCTKLLPTTVILETVVCAVLSMGCAHKKVPKCIENVTVLHQKPDTTIQNVCGFQ